MASIYGGASGNGWKLRLDYTVTQDRAANSSSLRLRLYLYANTTGSYNLEKDSAYYVLQGQKVYQTYQYTSPGWYLLGERTVTVRHGADGNGSVQLGGQWVSDVESSWTPASLSVSAAVALPRILRPSVLRAAELTLGQACVLSIRAEEERYTPPGDVCAGRRQRHGGAGDGAAGADVDSAAGAGPAAASVCGGDYASDGDHL